MSVPSVVIEAVLKSPDVCAIRFSGRLDRQSRGGLFEAIRTAIADNTREIEVDLADVYDVDPSVLGMMFTLRDKAKATGKSLSVAY